MQLKLNFLSFGLLLATTLCAQEKLLLRTPAINNDGSLVAFSYQGDIWTVSSKGGNAQRLTIHEAHETKPLFSPDGKQIAFTGARFGNNDIFVMPSTGGMPTRLTFRSTADNLSSWTIQDQIVFSSNREFKSLERPSEVYAISPKGGTESRVLDALGHDPAFSPDGKFLLFVRGDINPVAREDYKGSSDRDIYLYDVTQKTYQLLPCFETNDILPQWGSNNEVYYLSSIDGTYNLYQMKLDAKGKVTQQPKKITNYKDEAIRSFNISADGRSIVFEKDMNIYLLNTATNAVNKINVEIRADDRMDAYENKSFNSGAEEYAVSPNGNLMAFSIRGEIFIKEIKKDNTRSVNVSKHSFRDINPVFLNDSTLLFTSDRSNGNFDIYMVRSADTTQIDLFKTMKHEVIQLTKTGEDETSVTVSNKGNKLAYVRGKGTFVVADISPAGLLSNEKILSDTWDAPGGIAWSPDDQWLAYSLNDLYANEEIYVQPADNSKKAVNVSMHPRPDYGPVWSGDGTKLGFTSRRSTSKVTEAYFVWLKKVDWEKDADDWKEDVKQDSTKSKKNAVVPVNIDLEGIHRRLVQVTNVPGNVGNLNISKDGETFYFTTNNSDVEGNDLYSIKWDGKSLKELTKGGTNPGNVTMDAQGKFLFYSGRGGNLSKFDLKSNTSESLPFNARLKIDYVEERTQVFEEAWRTIRDGYYDPNFHGYDWGKLHDKYKDRCVYASTSEDFAEMFNLLLGEINSSHMGLNAPSRNETQRETTGLLGAEVVPVNGGIKVGHIIPETPADKEKSKLIEGDVITAVNGEMITSDDNFFEFLNGTVNEKVLLTVKSPDGKEREVVMRMVSSVTDQLYQEWVDTRAKMVEEFSKGKLGYVHIRGMNFESFEVVERAFTEAGFGKDGLVIDVRYNGGGSTTDYLMAILDYKQHAYAIPRGASENLERDKLKFREYYPLGERPVYAPWIKPSIVLCNEGSYSNAEVFSHAYQSLKIGKLVGVPTNGSVISTGAKSLMDGSTVRLPLRGWFTKTTNKNQELGPAIPDIIVENEVNWLARGTDDQLKVAVTSLLAQIRENK